MRRAAFLLASLLLHWQGTADEIRGELLPSPSNVVLGETYQDGEDLEASDGMPVAYPEEAESGEEYPPESDRISSSEIMRFGKKTSALYSQPEIMRFGKKEFSYNPQIMRFGKRSVGVSPNGHSVQKRSAISSSTFPGKQIMHFGKKNAISFSNPEMMRFGKKFDFSNPQIMRFGKKDWDPTKAHMMHFGKKDSAFSPEILRFGKRKATFGNAQMMHFGKRDSSDVEASSSALPLNIEKREVDFHDRQIMHFGKKDMSGFNRPEILRFGKRKTDEDEIFYPLKNYFLKFGKKYTDPFSNPQIMRFGKRQNTFLKMQDMMRFGRNTFSNPQFMRFGRRALDALNSPEFMRFGKKAYEPQIMRFGKNDKSLFETRQMLHFGKRAPYLDAYTEHEKKDFASPQIMRFGKRTALLGMPQIMRFGKRSDDDEEEDPSSFAERMSTRAKRHAEDKSSHDFNATAEEKKSLVRKRREAEHGATKKWGLIKPKQLFPMYEPQEFLVPQALLVASLERPSRADGAWRRHRWPRSMFLHFG